MENIVKRYELDMEKHERKIKKMIDMDKKGIKYDPNEIELTDEEPDKGTPVERLADLRKYKDLNK